MEHLYDVVAQIYDTHLCSIIRNIVRAISICIIYNIRNCLYKLQQIPRPTKPKRNSHLQSQCCANIAYIEIVIINSWSVRASATVSRMMLARARASTLFTFKIDKCFYHRSIVCACSSNTYIRHTTHTINSIHKASVVYAVLAGRGKCLSVCVDVVMLGWCCQ